MDKQFSIFLKTKGDMLHPRYKNENLNYNCSNVLMAIRAEINVILGSVTYPPKGKILS